MDATIPNARRATEMEKTNGKHVIFTSMQANHLCANCGHELDKHGIYQGMTEEPCRWSAQNGDCECVDFRFGSDFDRNPDSWKFGDRPYAVATD